MKKKGDVADQATAQTDWWLDKVKSAQAARHDFSACSAFECEDCGSDIPEARRKIGGITRCVECQTDHEKRG